MTPPPTPPTPKKKYKSNWPNPTAYLPKIGLFGNKTSKKKHRQKKVRVLVKKEYYLKNVVFTTKGPKMGKNHKKFGRLFHKTGLHLSLFLPSNRKNSMWTIRHGFWICDWSIFEDFLSKRLFRHKNTQNRPKTPKKRPKKNLKKQKSLFTPSAPTSTQFWPLKVTNWGSRYWAMVFFPCPNNFWATFMLF